MTGKIKVPSTEELEQVAGEFTRYERLPRTVKLACLLLSVVGIGLAIFYNFGLTFRGETLIDIAYYWLFIALFLPGVFLIMPARKSHKKIPWYDLVLAAASFGLGIFCYTHSSLTDYLMGWTNLPVGIIVWLLVLEAARRSGGPFYFGVCLILGLYPLFADYMPGLLWGTSNTFEGTVRSMIFKYEGLMGLGTKTLAQLIFGFLVFAGVMVGSGVGELFLNLANSLLGKYRGGGAKVSVLASAFFGMLSGSALSNVIGVGSITIPVMKRIGYPPEYAGAIEACASTGGVLMPPVMGAVAFVMCQMIGVEYRTVVIAAAIPSFFYYAGLLAQVDAYAARVGLVGIPREEIPSLKKSLLQAWPVLLTVAFLIWGLLYMRMEAKAPWFASALLLALSFRSRKTMITPRKLANVLIGVMKLVVQTTALLLPIGFVMNGLTITGVSSSFAAGIVALGHGNIFLILLLGAVACYAMGMVGLLTAAYIFLGVTLALGQMQLGGYNLIAVHLFILYYSMLAVITPPVAAAAFMGAAIAGADPMKTSMRAIRLGSVIYFIPFFFVLNPALILQGNAWEALYLVPLCLIGILFIAAGLEGYLLKVGKLELWARPVIVVGGFLVAFPSFNTTYIGAAIVAFVIAASVIRKRTALKKPAVSGS